MNPETGEFVKETQAVKLPELWPHFEIGAVYEIGGHRFRLDRVYNDSMRVRLTDSFGSGERHDMRRPPKMRTKMNQFSIGMIVNIGGSLMKVKAVCKDSLVLMSKIKENPHDAQSGLMSFEGSQGALR